MDVLFGVQVLRIGFAFCSRRVQTSGFKELGPSGGLQFSGAKDHIVLLAQHQGIGGGTFIPSGVGSVSKA